jgi:hypothetical protein
MVLKYNTVSAINSVTKLSSTVLEYLIIEINVFFCLCSKLKMFGTQINKKLKTIFCDPYIKL